MAVSTSAASEPTHDPHGVLASTSSPAATQPGTDGPIILGPMLRYVDSTRATVWVETAAAGEVSVRIDESVWTARTFGAHGHHYALVVLDGLTPSTRYEYRVQVNGEDAWPLPDSSFGPSVLRTFDADRPTTLAFGSCRVSGPHDEAGNKENGIDSLRAYAHEMARSRDDERWPDILVMLGDQVYADETSDEMQEFIEQRRGLSDPPGKELKDFIEYAHLYRLAYEEPAVRWLLSTLPSTMIFDDHDVRDDWNTSQTWHEEMNAKPWWHERIVGALGSYWVYQHCGNISPDALAQDRIWREIQAHAGEGEYDATELIDMFGEQVDADPTTYRFSYTRDFGDSRLIVIDSRAARDLRPNHRAMLDSDELAWVDEQMRGDVDHLFIGTSLPFFMPEGLHMLEALDEAAAEGAWGQPVAWIGERVRQAVDLEHWAAFHTSFFDVSEMVLQVARGERGRAPSTIAFLSGDIHNSFLSQVQDAHETKSRIFQAVCSPIRNPLPRHVRVIQSAIGRGLAWPLRRVVTRTSKVETPNFRWRTTHGPWFDNNLATVAVSGDELEFRWESGEIVDGDTDHPRLRTVAKIDTRSDEETSDRVKRSSRWAGMRMPSLRGSKRR